VINLSHPLSNTSNVSYPYVPSIFPKHLTELTYLDYWNALMTRHFPKIFISVKFNWLQKCVGTVRWGICFSAVFSITAGVRQGGLLSPALFAIYIGELIRRLKSSKFGCCLKAVYYGCLVYADDVLLLSQLVQVMQNMVDICESHAVDFDVKFNCIKSVAIRIGPRHN